MKQKLYMILLLILMSIFCVNGNMASTSRIQAAKKTYEPPAGSKEAKYISGLDLSKKREPTIPLRKRNILKPPDMSYTLERV